MLIYATKEGTEKQETDRKTDREEERKCIIILLLAILKPKKMILQIKHARKATHI